MTLTYLALSNPNDGLGTPLRDGGQIINDNFDFVNPRQFGLGSAKVSSETSLGTGITWWGVNTKHRL